LSRRERKEQSLNGKAPTQGGGGGCAATISGYGRGCRGTPGRMGADHVRLKKGPSSCGTKAKQEPTPGERKNVPHKRTAAERKKLGRRVEEKERTGAEKKRTHGGGTKKRLGWRTRAFAKEYSKKPKKKKNQGKSSGDA